MSDRIQEPTHRTHYSRSPYDGYKLIFKYDWMAFNRDELTDYANTVKRQKGHTIREHAAYVGLGYGTTWRILSGRDELGWWATATYLGAVKSSLARFKSVFGERMGIRLYVAYRQEFDGNEG